MRRPIFILLIGSALLQLTSADVEKRFRVPESVDAGFLVGYVTDKSLSPKQRHFTVHYAPDSLESDGVITIDESTGEIRTRKTLDYERKRTYNILALPLDGSSGV